MPVFNFFLSFFIEFGALVSFLFFAYLFNFFVGVYFLIIFTILSLYLSWKRDKRLPFFAIYAGVAVLFFGFLSIIFNEEYFVVFEFTLYNIAFAFAALIGFVKEKPIMKMLFPTMFEITDKGWQIMSISWGVFFLFTAFLNEFFWHFYTEEVWLIFRIVTIIVSTLFGLSLFLVAKRERLPGSNSWGLKKFE